MVVPYSCYNSRERLEPAWLENNMQWHYYNTSLECIVDGMLVNVDDCIKITTLVRMPKRSDAVPLTKAVSLVASTTKPCGQIPCNLGNLRRVYSWMLSILPPMLGSHNGGPFLARISNSLIAHSAYERSVTCRLLVLLLLLPTLLDNGFMEVTNARSSGVTEGGRSAACMSLVRSALARWHISLSLAFSSSSCHFSAVGSRHLLHVNSLWSSMFSASRSAFCCRNLLFSVA